jgi:hypothetical protein
MTRCRVRDVFPIRTVLIHAVKKMDRQVVATVKVKKKEV